MVEQEGPEYWEWETKRTKSTEQTFLEDQKIGYDDQPWVASSRKHFGVRHGFCLSTDHSISALPFIILAGHPAVQSSFLPLA